MVVSIFLSIFAEKKLIDMHYNYGKTKVALVKTTGGFEGALQRRIDEIEKENGYVVDIKFAYHDTYCLGLIIYKCTESYEQAKEQ